MPCLSMARLSAPRLSIPRLSMSRLSILRLSRLSMSRLLQSLLLLLLAAGLLTTGLAQAQQAPWPSRAVTLVVPFAAGSGTDSVARIVAARLANQLGQPVVVDNRAGANGQIAAQHVANAAPDGYTLLMTTNTSHSANPSLVANLKYDPIKDFTPITRVGELPFALVINAKDQTRDLKQWIADVRRQPGKFSYATPNSTSLVASETIKRIAGLELTAVPYRASPQAMVDLLGGLVQMYVVDLGSGMEMIKAGRVRVLGLTTRQLLDAFPGVPPIASEVAGFDLTSWNGVFGPAKLPPAIVQRLDRELLAVLDDANVKAQLRQIGFEIWPSESPDAFARYVAEQLEHWTSLVKQAGIEPQ